MEYQTVMSTTPASPGVCATESFYSRGDTNTDTDLSRLHSDKGCFPEKSDWDAHGADQKKYYAKLVSRTKLKLCGKKQPNLIQKKTLTCHQCQYTTDRKNNLKRHIVTMHQNCNKILECCGVLFDSKSSLKEHVSLFHSSGYQCQVCGRNFCRKALLRRHLSVHSGQKDYKCPLCSYATSHKSNLERHHKVHEKKLSLSDGLHFNTSDGSLNKNVGCAKKHFEETKYLTKCKSFSRKFDMKERKNYCKEDTSIKRRSLKLKESRAQLERESDSSTENCSVVSNKSFSDSQKITSGNTSEIDVHTYDTKPLSESHTFFTYKDLSKFENTDSCHGRMLHNDAIENPKSRTQNSDFNQNQNPTPLYSNSYRYSYRSSLEDRSTTDVDMCEKDNISDQNLLDENSNIPRTNITDRKKRDMRRSYRTDNSLMIKSRLCTSPYKCQVCCDTFTSQFEFLSHCCDNVNQKHFLLPVTCMVMKKSQVR